ncbi:MAG: hypothetical protein KBS68_06910 [Clostridiales bacterium]|nr:hypothetical protein [Candidatus Crickella merdequi]
MHTERKILALIGGMFVLIGGVISAVFIPVFGMPIGAVPLIFPAIGAGLLYIPIRAGLREKKALSSGERYTAKVFGYVEDSSITINDQYPINIKVRFFDKNHNICETTLETRFPKGNVPYAIGSTLDIYGLNGIYSFDPDSVRFEKLKEEELLMDNRPLEPEKTDFIAVTCPNCGSSYKAIKGFAEKCPYCGSYSKSV